MADLLQFRPKNRPDKKRQQYKSSMRTRSKPRLGFIFMSCGIAAFLAVGPRSKSQNLKTSLRSVQSNVALQPQGESRSISSASSFAYESQTRSGVVAALDFTRHSYFAVSPNTIT